MILKKKSSLQAFQGVCFLEVKGSFSEAPQAGLSLNPWSSDLVPLLAGGPDGGHCHWQQTAEPLLRLSGEANEMAAGGVRAGGYEA